MGEKLFSLKASFQPTGDQPEAIEKVSRALIEGRRHVGLEGVTGSGKTFTMANVIERVNRPTLIISHNKTLAAQLFAEFKAFFPDNAVEYFISYYDYYQPESYIPQTDTYIEKDASINEEIERYRLGAINSLVSRRDVIVVASVSCIYGLGEPQDFKSMLIVVREGEERGRERLLRELVENQFVRNDYDLTPGSFRVRGDTVDVIPAHETDGYRIGFFGDEIETIHRLDAVTGKTVRRCAQAVFPPAKPFVMPAEKMKSAEARIREELKERLAWFESKGKLLEAQRLRQRTEFDLEMLRELGYCTGIENYSRHLEGRAEGEPPACLIDYFPDDFVTLIDESHVTLPQLRAMFNGDRARKNTLVDNGFRLPSAKDNRPLVFDEFMAKTGPILYVSATPGSFERAECEVMAEQLIRPTGLLDPIIDVRPLENQIDDLMEEVRKAAEAGERTLVTTLTKRSAEDLTAYLSNAGIKVEYLHSDVKAFDRVELLRRLRKGDYDCLVGINLLREGLDLPEVALVAVLDADKEGFLRSATSLMQTAGRAARHERGRVIMYAEHVTTAMRESMELTARRRKIQEEYNRKHGIVPRSVSRMLNEELVRSRAETSEVEKRPLGAVSEEEYDLQRVIADLEREMVESAEALEFERAAMLRDELKLLKSQM